MTKYNFDFKSVTDYRRFLQIKALPSYQMKGRTAIFPNEYARMIGLKIEPTKQRSYDPSPFLFDYQRDISDLAIRKRKFCVFADPGLGKTLCYMEYAYHVMPQLRDQCGLFICPKMVIQQTIDECKRFYGQSIFKPIEASQLQSFLESGKGMGITNFESLKQSVRRGRLGMLIVDESSMLKSHYGKWGTKINELGKGLEWKLAGTGTPAPNDRIEYANHAVLMDAFPNVNSFLAKFFVNKGQTGERWVLKDHARSHFYRALSHWCIFLHNPTVYGWKDNTTSIPPVCVHIHDVDLTPEQEKIAFANRRTFFFDGKLGGIGSRTAYGQLAKGHHNGKNINTKKPEYIRQLVDSWPDESTLIWCIYNEEQKTIENILPEAATIDGTTPHEVRLRLIHEFQTGQRKQLITKGKILGFGLNLQIATRQIFSGCQDSYETFYQCVKRSNRVGSTRPLNVHIPVTDIERPLMENVLRKAANVQRDTEIQEKLFSENNYQFFAHE